MRFPMPNHPCDFEIPDDWLTEARMNDFIPVSRTYHSTVEVVSVPLVEIEPPFRVPACVKNSRGFDRERLDFVLRGIATGAQIPPVSLQELPLAGPYRYRVCDGFHRFYASIAADFKYLPGVVSRVSSSHFTNPPPLALPALVTAAGDRAGSRFFEFFAAQIRNPHTRRAHARAGAAPSSQKLKRCGRHPKSSHN
jgi:hypothetical protein